MSQNFTSSRIFYNTYYFDLAQMKTVNVNLTNVASDTILNLYVYDNNKLPRWVDDLPFEGWNKSVNLPNLPPGRYFVVVQQTFPVQVNPGNYYQIRVNQ
ncbi:MAG: PPC domain-containing protein [Chloroflexi bacterium]|nr:PPC domain-containing protein [Chloroflexota bacterium]